MKHICPDCGKEWYCLMANCGVSEKCVCLVCESEAIKRAVLEDGKEKEHIQ